MNERLSKIRRNTRDGKHKALRQSKAPEVLTHCEAAGFSWPQRVSYLTRVMCEAEKVIIEPDEDIVFTRTIPEIPPVYSHEQWQNLTKGRTLHELGPISNICADWDMVLGQGLHGRKQVALATLKRFENDPQKVEFLNSAIETIGGSAESQD